ncbi:hypothetical protein KY343_06095 [Candidatus Woesearchaeota archaeon]|nr:hypothetical protein [Candidatus Woesearchaeota archaeon]
MEKEPGYYGKARFIDERSADFKHLDNLDYHTLDRVVYEAAQRNDAILKKAALDRMHKQYLNSLVSWIASVKEGDLGDSEYLEQCNELLKYGLNNRHEEVLIEVWPLIKKVADKLVFNLRSSKYSSARKKYHYYSGAIEVAAGLRERVDAI